MGGPGFGPVNAASMAIAQAAPVVQPRLGMMAYAAQPTQVVQVAPQRVDASRGNFGYNDSRFTGRGQESSSAG